MTGVHQLEQNRRVYSVEGADAFMESKAPPSKNLGSSTQIRLRTYRPGHLPARLTACLEETDPSQERL
jgi:hypothetical protein